MSNFYFPEKDKKHLTEDEASQLGNAHAEMVEGLISKSLIAIGGKLQSDEEIFRHLRKPGFKSYKKWWPVALPMPSWLPGACHS